MQVWLKSFYYYVYSYSYIVKHRKRLVGLKWSSSHYRRQEPWVSSGSSSVAASQTFTLSKPQQPREDHPLKSPFLDAFQLLVLNVFLTHKLRRMTSTNINTVYMYYHVRKQCRHSDATSFAVIADIAWRHQSFQDDEYPGGYILW